MCKTGTSQKLTKIFRIVTLVPRTRVREREGERDEPDDGDVHDLHRN